MTVAELIKQLQNLPQDALVLRPYNNQGEYSEEVYKVYQGKVDEDNHFQEDELLEMNLGFEPIENGILAVEIR